MFCVPKQTNLDKIVYKSKVKGTSNFEFMKIISLNSQPLKLHINNLYCNYFMPAINSYLCVFVTQFY